MKTIRVLVFLSLLVVLGACNNGSPNTGAKSQTISDGNHNNGNRHFYFLPPLVPAPTYTGTFNPNLSPTVEVCELGQSGCVATVASFSMTSGTGSEVIRVSLTDQLYIVNWHTDLSNLNLDKFYRIRVLLGSFVAGYADVDPVNNGKELKNVDTGQYIGLVNGRTLPIKFRLETGVLPPTVTLTASATSVTAPGTVTLTATATDDLGVIRVEFYEGTTLLSTDTNFPYTKDVSFIPTESGLHTYIALAYDDYSSTTSNSVTINVVAPNPWIGIKQFSASNFSGANGVAVDLNGNVFVTGFTNGSFPGYSNMGGPDAFLSKFGSDGNLIRVKQIGTFTNDQGNGVAVDRMGNVIIAGFTSGTFEGTSNSGGTDGFVIKFSNSGDILWIKQFGTPNIDQVWRVAVDQDNNIYVCGMTEGAFPGNSSGGGQDILVGKFNSDGEILWIKQLGGSGDQNGFDVFAFNNHQLYIAGKSDTAFVARLDPNTGSIIWTKSIGNPTLAAFGVSADSGGSIYVSGYISTGMFYPNQFDAFVAKLDGSGNTTWLTPISGSGDDYATGGIAITSDGNVVTTGYTKSSLLGNSFLGGFSDAYVAKLNSMNGNITWLTQFGSPGEDIANGVAADGEGNAYVIGHTKGSLLGNVNQSGYDAFLAKLGSNGDIR